MTEIAKEKKPMKKSGLRPRENETISRGKITRLTNSRRYFLHSVFIMAVKKGFNLIVVNNCQFKRAKVFKTLRGAKIAFEKEFHKYACIRTEKANWSEIYEPETLPMS